MQQDFGGQCGVVLGQVRGLSGWAALYEVMSGSCREIGAEARFEIGGSVAKAVRWPDHHAALAACLEALDAAGHASGQL